MNPLISVVVPVYNREFPIKAALRSVQEQTYGNWEAVVVDDGSEDETARIVKKIIGEDSRVRLIRHEKNRGSQAARNTGIKAAKGEWISFLDSDDEYFPGSIELRLKEAEKYNVSAVHSECEFIGKYETRKVYGLPTRIGAGKIYKRLLTGEGIVFPSLLVSKKALCRINYLDEKIVSFQEWETAIRLAKYYEFGFVSSPTFVYNDQSMENRVSKGFSSQAKGYSQVIRKHMWEMFIHTRPEVLARHFKIMSSLYGDAEVILKSACFELASAVFRVIEPRIYYRKIQMLFKGARHAGNR